MLLKLILKLFFLSVVSTSETIKAGSNTSNTSQLTLEPRGLSLFSFRRFLFNCFFPSAELNSPFNNLPVDVLILIFSYHDKFPILAGVNKNFRSAYENHQLKLIRDRLDGFDPGNDFRELGSLITMNYADAVDYKALATKIKQIEARKQDKNIIDIRTKLIAYHTLKRFSLTVVSHYMKVPSFAMAAMQIIMKEERFNDFKFLFRYCWNLSSHMPSEYNQILAFIAKNHEKLLNVFLATIKPLRPPGYESRLRPDYDQVYSYISVLIRLSVSEEEFRLNLNSLREFDLNIFSSAKIKNFLFNSLPHIQTPHQKLLLKIVLDNNIYNLPIRYSMPLTILFEPDNWPPYGTWPSVFFPHGDEVLLAQEIFKIEMAEICVGLAKHWGLNRIADDIITETPLEMDRTHASEVSCIIQ